MTFPEFLHARDADWQSSDRLWTELLARTPDVNTLRDEDGSALRWAIGCHQERYALDLVGRGATLDEAGSDSLILAAAKQGQPRVVLAMLERGVEPGAEAVRVVTQLLSRTDDSGPPEHRDEYRTATVTVVNRLVTDANLAVSGRPLLMNARSGHGARALLALGADPNAASTYEYDDGATALHRAAEGGLDSVVEALLAGGARRAPLNSAKKTPAMLALKEGHVLVAAKLDPSLSGKLFTSLEKRRLGGRPMPADLRALWTSALAGDTGVLDAVGELTLLPPDDADVGEALGVPKKLKSKLWWFAAEADGALVGYFSDKAAPLEGSVVMFDNEGSIHAYGRTVAEFLVMRGAEVEAAELVGSWLQERKLVPERDVEQIVAGAKTQALPKV